MPLTLPAVDTTTLLVTPEELKAAALSSLALDISGGAGTEDYDQTALALQDAQRRVEGFLDRSLLVHVSTEYVSTWTSNARSTFTAYAHAWPLVALHADSGVTVADHTVSLDDRVVTVSTVPTATLALVTYAGYRGRQHTLDGASDTTALTDITDLADLATLPPEVPADIRRTIEELTLIYLNQARQGTLGAGSRIQQTGTSSNVIESVDRDAEDRLLKRIAHHRRIQL